MIIEALRNQFRSYKKTPSTLDRKLDSFKTPSRPQISSCTTDFLLIINSVTLSVITCFLSEPRKPRVRNAEWAKLRRKNLCDKKNADDTGCSRGTDRKQSEGTLWQPVHNSVEWLNTPWLFRVVHYNFLKSSRGANMVVRKLSLLFILPFQDFSPFRP